MAKSLRFKGKVYRFEGDPSDDQIHEFFSNVDAQTSQPEDIESKGFSGIASDASSKVLDALGNIPSALSSLPEEVVGAGEQLFSPDNRFEKNIVTGLGELGHGVLSAPGNVRDYLVKKDLISKSSPSLRLPEAMLPREFNYADALGIKGNQPGDALIRSLPAQVAASPLVGRLLSSVKSLPLTKSMAASPLRQVEKIVKERNIDSLPISKSVLKETNNFIPKSLPYRELLQQAKTGDYNSLFTLQSDLGKIGHELRKSSSGAERLHGLEALKLRDRYLVEMKDGFKKLGHDDAAELIDKGRSRYKFHMKYRKPVKNAAILGLAGLGAKSAYNKGKSLIPH